MPSTYGVLPSRRQSPVVKTGGETPVGVKHDRTMWAPSHADETPWVAGAATKALWNKSARLSINSSARRYNRCTI